MKASAAQFVDTTALGANPWRVCDQADRRIGEQQPTLAALGDIVEA